MFYALSNALNRKWDVLSGVAEMAWDVLSGVTKTAWDVLSWVANLCGMFCLGWQKMAWDVCPGMFCPTFLYTISKSEAWYVLVMIWYDVGIKSGQNA